VRAVLLIRMRSRIGSSETIFVDNGRAFFFPWLAVSRQATCSPISDENTSCCTNGFISVPNVTVNSANTTWSAFFAPFFCSLFFFCFLSLQLSTVSPFQGLVFLSIGSMHILREFFSEGAGAFRTAASGRLSHRQSIIIT